MSYMRDRVVEMKEEVENLKKEYQENTFAMDILKDAKNNELMQYLQHQDTDYLETIIDQNRQIIDLLKERE